VASALQRQGTNGLVSTYLVTCLTWRSKTRLKATCCSTTWARDCRSGRPPSMDASAFLPSSGCAMQRALAPTRTADSSPSSPPSSAASSAVRTRHCAHPAQFPEQSHSSRKLKNHINEPRERHTEITHKCRGKVVLNCILTRFAMPQAVVRCCSGTRRTRSRWSSLPGAQRERGGEGGRSREGGREQVS
jgi:hypothetical protein